MSGLSNPRRGAATPTPRRRTGYTVGGVVADGLRLLLVTAIAAWPGGLLARATWELVHIGWRAWPW